MLKYLVSRKGLLSFGVAHTVAFAKTRPELAHPDVQLHMMAASMDLKVLAETQGLQLEREPGMTCNPCQLRARVPREHPHQVARRHGLSGD